MSYQRPILNNSESYMNRDHYVQVNVASGGPLMSDSKGYGMYNKSTDDFDSRSTKSYQTYNSSAPLHHPLYTTTQSNVNLLSGSSYSLPPPPSPPTSYPPSSPYSPPSPMAFHPASGTEYQQPIQRQRQNIPLMNGNFVLEQPVPSNVKRMMGDQTEWCKRWGCDQEEVNKMRYTAITCDPDDFAMENYRLRVQERRRQTELFIVLTMYNEDDVLFTRTMNSVIKNIVHLQSRTSSKTWGTAVGQAWQKVTVCIVSDGRAKVNKRVLKVLGLMGCYQDGIAKDTIAGKDVKAHLFEYTTSVMVTMDHGTGGEVKATGIPVQIMFCLKEQNKKKLNSHRWFFNAFSAVLRPNVCVLIDVGTKPSGTSIYHLWKAFDKDSGVGGACGEITVDAGRGCGGILKNPLVAAQNFEYKMSNILDKPLESVFGYISVLPGAFSAYRYKALLGQPLSTYFKGEKFHEPGYTAGVFESNMFLAEDRVLCFEIVTKKREAWKLKYVKSAKASTDVPETAPEFISQRRRWLNGSFFAAVHATFNFPRIWTSGQNPLRMLWLQIEFIYNAFVLFFTWTALGNFYLAFYFLTSSATSDSSKDPFGGQGTEVLGLINKLYIALLGVILICALGNRPQGSNYMYVTVMVGFAVVFGIELYCAGWTLWLDLPHTLSGWENIKTLLSTSAFRDILISLIATYGLYVISSILHLEIWHLFTSFIQYMFLLPSFVSVLSIYAFSNLHDVTWGTKGQTAPDKNLGAAKKSGKEEVVEVDIPTTIEAIDEMWYQMKKDISVPYSETKSAADPAQKQEDHYRNFRTNVLLIYFGTNMFLVIFFSSSYWLSFFPNTNINPYMTFIFWSVAGMAAVRFFGSTWYLLLRLVGW